MKTLSDGLRSTLRELVGTRNRFILGLFCQTFGFGLAIRRLGGSVEEKCVVGIFGLVLPVLLIVTLRQVFLEVQQGSGDGNDSA